MVITVRGPQLGAVDWGGLFQQGMEVYKGSVAARADRASAEAAAKEAARIREHEFQLEQLRQAGFGGGIPPVVMWGGLGLLAVMMLGSGRRRRG